MDNPDCDISLHRCYQRIPPGLETMRRMPLRETQESITDRIKQISNTDGVLLVSLTYNPKMLTIWCKYCYQNKNEWMLWGKAVIHLLGTDAAAAKRICDKYQQDLGMAK